MKESDKIETLEIYLAVAEIEHLKIVAGCVTVKDLQDNFKEQARLRNMFPKTEPCYECKAIEQKMMDAMGWISIEIK